MHFCLLFNYISNTPPHLLSNYIHKSNAGQYYTPDKQQRLSNWWRQPVSGFPRGLVPNLIFYLTYGLLVGTGYVLSPTI